MTTAYRSTWQQLQRIETHPSVSAKFAIEKGLWEGRKVAVRYLHVRGSYRRHTDMRIVYGTLVLAPNGPERRDQIGVRDESGEVYVIHVNRAADVYDMTREK